MKKRNYAHYGIAIIATIILLAVCFLGASPITIKSVSQFDDLVSNPSRPLTIVLASNEPTETDRAIRKQNEAVRKGFNELSKQKLYKKAEIQFLLVSLDKFPSLQKEFNIKDLNHRIIYFELYHKGKLIADSSCALLDFDKNIKDLIFDKCQRFISNEAGDIIDDIIQEKQDKAWELEKLRAQAPVYWSTPFYYDPWYGYGGYGYGWGFYGGYRRGWWW